ncbi:hypothetical protein KAS08_04075 [Candidatus Pacearchaeota archaeon]|nr:hypothetical protein [Candidatus Pacearchaeota archaeon]
MNTQINLRLPELLLKKAQAEVRRQGFMNVQELIKESLRKTLYEIDGTTQEELGFLRKLYKISEDKNLYGTEDELFDKLNKE